MRHAVIMAGGSGTRLWPLSRAERPKQLLDVVAEAVPAARTACSPRRSAAHVVVPAECIWVCTAARYADVGRSRCPSCRPNGWFWSRWPGTRPTR